MSLAFPCEIRIPSQGIFRKFDDRSQLTEFVENEEKFFRDISSLVGGSVIFGNSNFGNQNFSENAARMFERLKKDESVESLEQYVEAAQDLEILVAQGRIGSQVSALLERQDQQAARWAIFVLCSRWTGGEPNKALDPFRAVLFTNPATFAFGDLISTTEAMERSSTAASAIEQAKHDLTDFIRVKTDLFEKLEDLYRRKLTLDEPALTWQKIAERKTAVWIVWLAIFAILVAAPIVLAVLKWSVISEAITKLTAGANGSFSVAGLATITVPALFYAWLLKNVSRVFIQNLNLADDAAHRRSLALTYMGLLQDEKHPASDQDRAIILNALFRPIPPQTADEGPPAGLVDLIRSKG